MSSNYRGRVPRGRSCCGPLVAVSSLALIAGGCAHDTQNPYSHSGWYAGGPQTAAVAAASPPTAAVEMEDDGHPAQLPPRAGIRGVKDDPREPWSPNYGGPAATARPDKNGVTDQQAAGSHAVQARRVAFVPHD